MTYLNRLCPSIKVCHISMKVDVHIKENNLNILWWSSFQFFGLSYYVSEIRAVMSVMISSYTRCPVRLYLQLFVGGLVSYLRYLCLLVHSGVQHILCCFLLWFSSSMLQVPLDCSCLIASSVFSNVYSVIFKDNSLNRHNLFIFILQGTIV